MKSDIEIARSIELKKIKVIADSIGIPRDEVENYGRYIAKIPETLVDEEKVKQSNLILVTAITATKTPRPTFRSAYRATNPAANAMKINERHASWLIISARSSTIAAATSTPNCS